MKCVYHAYFGIKLVEKELILVDYSPHLSPQKELNDLACKVLCWDEDLRKKKSSLRLLASPFTPTCIRSIILFFLQKNLCTVSILLNFCTSLRGCHNTNPKIGNYSFTATNVIFEMCFGDQDDATHEMPKIKSRETLGCSSKLINLEI